MTYLVVYKIQGREYQEWSWTQEAAMDTYRRLKETRKDADKIEVYNLVLIKN